MKTLRIILIGLTLGTSAAAFGAQPAKPAANTDKPVATCRDGKTYYNATGEHRGACSGHGGVAAWADGTPVKAKRGTSYR
jgi:predicted lipoprotein with Yx(FWY)xxD motif